MALWTPKGVTLACFLKHHHSLWLERGTVVWHATFQHKASPNMSKKTMAPFLTCFIWWSLVLGTRMGDEGTCKGECVPKGEHSILNHSDQNYLDQTCLIKYCTMLGLLTTVVLFLRLRRTSLWNTWELSLEWKIHRPTMCHVSFYPWSQCNVVTSRCMTKGTNTFTERVCS